MMNSKQARTQYSTDLGQTVGDGRAARPGADDYEVVLLEDGQVAEVRVLPEVNPALPVQTVDGLQEQKYGGG